VAEGPALTIYPAFHLKFAGEGRNYLLAGITLVNVSGQEMRDLFLTQRFPEDLAPASASGGIYDYLARPEGFEETIEGQTYQMRVSLLRRRELTAGYVVLSYHGRPAEATVAPCEITYTVSGQTRSERGPALTLPLTKYSKYSGSLADFIKRYASLQLRLPETPTADWGFSALASKVRGKTPFGLVEVEGDAAEGRFSLLSGAPGETREILVAWKPTAKARSARSEEDVRKILGEQIVAAAEFSIDLAGAAIEKMPLARGSAWVVSARWRDRVPARLGEGPVRWYVYEDPQRSAQYIILVRAQGRGAGPGKADVPSPEKESALMAELEGIVKSLRPL